MIGCLTGVYHLSCLRCLGGGPGIELIPHPGRPSMSLCGQKSMYVIQSSSPSPDRLWLLKTWAAWVVVVGVVVVVDLCFMMLLTSQVISVTFYNEHKKSNKFCPEALILAWGSFTCRKPMTWGPRLYFPPEGSHSQEFYALKKSIDHCRVWTREPRIQWWV